MFLSVKHKILILSQGAFGFLLFIYFFLCVGHLCMYAVALTVFNSL